MRQSGWAYSVATAALLTVACTRSAGTGHSVHDGVFTSEQAVHGKDVYGTMCLSCHAGMGNHTGAAFRARWGGGSLLDMYQFISTNMPKNDPGTLSPDDNIAVIAYLLQLNGMPTGVKALPVDTLVLKAIIYDTTATTR